MQQTACPGPYLEGRFPEIVDLVNARLDGGQAEPAPQNTNPNSRGKMPTTEYAHRQWLAAGSGKLGKTLQVLKVPPITDVAIRVERGRYKVSRSRWAKVGFRM